MSTIGLSSSIYIAYDWLSAINFQWNFTQLYYWSRKYDWLRVSKQSLATSAAINMVSLSSIIAGLFLVKIWINTALQG